MLINLMNMVDKSWFFILKKTGDFPIIPSSLPSSHQGGHWVYYEHGSAHLLTHPCHEHRRARPWHAFDLWKSAEKRWWKTSCSQWINGLVFKGKKLTPETIDFPSKFMGCSDEIYRKPSIFPVNSWGFPKKFSPWNQSIDCRILETTGYPLE